MSVDVFSHPEFDTPDGGVRVDPEGYLSLPYVDPIRVAGLAVAEARGRVSESVAPFVKTPRVMMNVLERAERAFFVAGEVGRPGRFTLDQPINALQGLAMGGGFRSGADRDEVVLIRAHGDELEAHVFNAATPDAGALVTVRPDDILFVRRSGVGESMEELLPFLHATAFATGSIANVVFALSVP